MSSLDRKELSQKWIVNAEAGLHNLAFHMFIQNATLQLAAGEKLQAL